MSTGNREQQNDVIRGAEEGLSGKVEGLRDEALRGSSEKSTGRREQSWERV